MAFSNSYLPPYGAIIRQARLTRQPLNLLLGNGFAIGASPSFAYKSLESEMIKSGIPKALFELAEIQGAHDLESVMQALETKAAWLSSISSCPTSEEFAQSFIGAISAVHPDSVLSLCPAALKAVGDHLHQFDGIWTTNYDQIINHAVVASLSGRPFRETLKDGFQKKKVPSDLSGQLVFTPQSKQWTRMVYYLHGALMLQRQGEYTTKRHWHGDGSLIEHIREDLNAKMFPLFVSGGSAKRKREIIDSSLYLAMAYHMFATMTGDLIIFGFAFNNADDHIADAIWSNSGISNLYVGLYGSPNDDVNIHITKTVNDRQRNGSPERGPAMVHFYDSSTAGIWYPDDPGPAIKAAERICPCTDTSQWKNRTCAVHLGRNPPCSILPSELPVSKPALSRWCNGDCAGCPR